MPCSQCEGIELEFNDAEARKKLRQLRRRGPDRTTKLLIKTLLDALDSPPSDTTLLDIGGGVGAIHHALLDHGVEEATHVDASSAYLTVAGEEAERLGHSGRVSFVRGDFVSIASEVAPASIVTLDRVICCYHDMDTLASLAAQRASRLLGAVYPRDTWWMRFGFRGVNVLFRLRGTGFRVFVHDPNAIHAVFQDAGLERRSIRRTLGWEVVLYERRAPK
jgi:methyltransferase family protein